MKTITRKRFRKMVMKTPWRKLAKLLGYYGDMGGYDDFWQMMYTIDWKRNGNKTIITPKYKILGEPYEPKH